MEQHVTPTGDVTGECVVSDRRPDGSLVLVPESLTDASMRAQGLRPATDGEAEAWFAQHTDVLLAPDGEG